MWQAVSTVRKLTPTSTGLIYWNVSLIGFENWGGNENSFSEGGEETAYVNLFCITSG